MENNICDIDRNTVIETVPLFLSKNKDNWARTLFMVLYVYLLMQRVQGMDKARFSWYPKKRNIIS